MHGIIISKLSGTGGQSDFYVFSEISYKILGPLPTTFSLLCAYLFDQKPLAGRMLLGAGINAAMLSEN